MCIFVENLKLVKWSLGSNIISLPDCTEVEPAPSPLAPMFAHIFMRHFGDHLSIFLISTNVGEKCHKVYEVCQK